MNFNHTSVLLHETVESLPVLERGIYVDGTLGGGGHTEALLKRLGKGARVIGIDQDDAALEASAKRLSPYKEQCTFIRDNFRNIKSILENLKIEAIDGAMLDLGVSSHQLDEAERGFSYQADAPLDMRMDRRKPFSAAELVNTFSEDELSKIIFDYGEERFARKIAKRIVADREDKPIETTGDLVRVIKEAIPLSARETGPHPAKRTFQAIRIAVNDELGLLKGAIEDFAEVLRPGGRLAVITFHSLEDRIVKQAFQGLSTACTCPPEFPVCVCGGEAKGKIVNKKPITADETELLENPRARSAKLRVYEKI